MTDGFLAERQLLRNACAMRRFGIPLAASALMVMRISRSVLATSASAIAATADEATRPTRRCVSLGVALHGSQAVALQGLPRSHRTHGQHLSCDRQSEQRVSSNRPHMLGEHCLMLFASFENSGDSLRVRITGRVDADTQERMAHRN